MEKLSPVETIIILGNGFDLSLGYPTKYSDFLNDKTFLNEKKNEAKSIAQITLLKAIETNYLTSNWENWIDLESELKKFALNRDETLTPISLGFLTECLTEYISKVTSDGYNMKSFAAKLIENKVDIKTTLYSFNYTTTLTRLLRSTGKNLEKNCLNYIHGDIVNKNIILGIEDSAAINEKLVFVKKAANKEYKAFDPLGDFRTINTIYFFGHSLGESDSMFFEPFFKEISKTMNKKIVFFYHSDEAFNNILGRLDRYTGNNLSEFRRRQKVTFIDCSLDYNIAKEKFPDLL